MKKKCTVLLSMMLVAAMLTGTIYGLFRDVTEEKTNTFALADVSAELVEVIYEMRGAVLHKEPFVINTGSAPCLVRVKVILDPEEFCDRTVTSAPSEAKKEELLNNGYRFWMDYQKEWEYDDGYWYYQDVLKPGEETSPVFRTVNWLDVDDDGNWLNYRDFDIYIYKEIVFAEGVYKSGQKITAQDSSGNYNDSQAKKVWAIYTQ